MKVKIRLAPRAKAIYKKNPNLIDLCDQNCKAWIYYDPEDGKIHNAEISKKDSIHICPVKEYAKKLMMSFNWYPSFSFLEQAYAFIEQSKRNYKAALLLEANLQHRQELNLQATKALEESKKELRTDKKKRRELSEFE